MPEERLPLFARPSFMLGRLRQELMSNPGGLKDRELVQKCRAILEEGDKAIRELKADASPAVMR